MIEELVYFIHLGSDKNRKINLKKCPKSIFTIV